MRFKVAIILNVLFIICFRAVSQPVGTITINKDYRVDYLLEKHLAIAKYEQTIDGFRVQIFFDSGNNSQTNANNSRTEFLRRYPDVPAYVSFDSPYYKVRVGDFRTRLEAQQFLNTISPIYTNAFIVLGQINYPKVE